MADFAEKLKVLMKIREISGNALAKLSGVPQTTISGYMRRENRPSWEHVQRLAIALGVSFADLTDDPPPPSPEPEPPPAENGKKKKPK